MVPILDFTSHNGHLKNSTSLRILLVFLFTLKLDMRINLKFLNKLSNYKYYQNTKTFVMVLRIVVVVIFMRLTYAMTFPHSV